MRRVRGDVSRLAAFMGISLVGVFPNGSRVMGTDTSTSDVDMNVVVAPQAVRMGAFHDSGRLARAYFRKLGGRSNGCSMLGERTIRAVMSRPEVVPSVDITFGAL